MYQELRGYIRIRQAYLTSPQHRLRASATTVLVSGIPRKWLTVEALNGLYDVFPGGIRNIWINRNFDELAEKVKERDSIAHDLEGAETSLIRNCVKKHKEAEEKKAKKEGSAKKTKLEKEQERKEADSEAEKLAQGEGISSGDPHSTPQNIHEVIDEINHEEHPKEKRPELRLRDPLLKIGQGLGAVGHGFGALGQMGKQLVGDVTNDVNKAIRTVNETVDAANQGPGFGAGYYAEGDEVYRASAPRPKREKEHVVEAATTPELSKTSDSNSTETNKPTGLRKPNDVDVLERDTPQSSPLRAFSSAESTKIGQSDRHSRSSSAAGAAKKPKIRINNKASREQGWLSRVWASLNKYKKDPPLVFPSPQPHAVEEDAFPLREIGHPEHPDLNEDPSQGVSKSKWATKFDRIAFWKSKPEEEEEEDTKEVYPQAYNEDCAEDEGDEPVWKRYMDPKEREIIRGRLINKSWFPRLPLMGKKIDKIYYLRKELARLNVEIEQDQQNVEKFPFMNSAFIQFNHQVAAHMACQSLSHHVPQHMTPRLVEIAPGDVLWENMSMKWWERYLRTAIVFVLAFGLIVLYAIPVSFTGFLSQVNYLASLFSWLGWLKTLPSMVKAIIQGVLPPVLLSVILTLVPIILRYLMKNRGVPTGSDKERGVQDYYFVFLFIQVFLVVTLSTGITVFVRELVEDTYGIATTLAKDLPDASDYFFSYLTVQALSNSASALVQVGTLLKWFLWAPVKDSTARQKWRRQTKLQQVKWGSFFPPFTNFAVIGIIFSTIAPLILVFNIIVFSVYWVAQRYNILYVYQFKLDTGGLLFPKAINQLFVGVYVLELCLVGLFFLARDTAGNVSAVPQAVIMIVVLVFTAIYQWLLNDAFQPLFRYLPITLEDDAVIRDEEFARAQESKFQRLMAGGADGTEDEDIQLALEDCERNSEEEERLALEEERKRIAAIRRNSQRMSSFHSGQSGDGIMQTKPASTWTGDRWRTPIKQLSQPVRRLGYLGREQRTGTTWPAGAAKPTATDVDPQNIQVDLESQQAVGDVLYSGFSDELEDLTPEERDTLIRYSFQHSALRARRPVVWIPRDNLGISDDEIERCEKMSLVEYIDPETEKRETKTNIWISNEGTALDAKDRVVFRRSPPDFANVDLIEL